MAGLNRIIQELNFADSGLVLSGEFMRDVLSGPALTRTAVSILISKESSFWFL